MQNQINHLAIIMDGNRRWAIENRKEKFTGHEVGLKNIKPIVKLCIKNNIKYLTLFSFSTENKNRSNEEIKKLFNLLGLAIVEYRDFLIKNNISIKFIGDLSIIENDLKKQIDDLMKYTNLKIPNLVLIIAFNYGGKQEIIEAIKKINIDKIDVNQINEKVLSDNLYNPEIPDPDLLIRTGGEMRLSNFLLWQIAYTELYFTKTNWPEFTIEELEQIFKDFNTRKRNFGK